MRQARGGGRRRDGGVPVEPEVLLDLIDGYWEGWLPDGVISLE
ncbi:hypothetical protein [Streptomyces noursei]|nr:hypothetical protein [Streptomyces noursei]MCZ1018935.1 hypothetical protein [Streptomyces noursei]